jgi:hypothetical protein
MTDPQQSANEQAEQAARDRARETDPRFRTADRALITNGLLVWDYDLKPGVVWLDEYRLSREYWDGWFDVIGASGYTDIMNGERLALRHPTTRDVPPPFVDTRVVELITALSRGATLVGDDHGRQLPVTYAPRVPTDPRPWRNGNYTRFTSAEVTAVAPS